jgi:hypothetical protein
LEEIYRGHRISVRQAGAEWEAKIWTVRGQVVPVGAHAGADDGAEICLVRARQAVDRYLAYVAP